MSPTGVFAWAGALTALTWALGQRDRSWRSVLVWTILAGPIFIGPASDQLARLLVGFIVAAALGRIVVTLLRTVKPAAAIRPPTGQ